MSKVLNMLRRGKTRTGALVAVIAAAIIVPATLYAWGPDRATFTEQNPAPYITFNSITDNSAYGDERDFVMIKESTAPDSTWSSTATAQAGKEYTVRMYVHNNAADHLNLVAENVRASASVQQGTAKNIAVSGFISANNSNPGQVWDDANLVSDKDFNVNYVPGSAYFRNNVFTNGTALPDDIMTSGGAQLGYDKLDGKVPGCYKYSGYVYFKIKPQFGENPDFKTTKYVSAHGKDEWKKDYQAQPGETVDYLLNYKNTGDTQQDDVTIKDTLPAGMTYVTGSSILGNSHHPDGTKTNDTVTTAGLNVGSYAPNGNAWVIFSAKVPSKDELECGDNTLKNTVRTTASGYYKEDTANVTVPKECQPEKIQVCELATKKIVTIDEADFDASKYSKNLDDCKEVPSQIIVCDLTTKQIITINEDEFDASKHSKNLEDCKTPEENCPIPGKEHLPANSAECETPVTPEVPTTPTTPTELPQTGSNDGALTIAGLATLALVLGYAVTARRTIG